MKTPSFCRFSGGGSRSAPLKTWSKNMRRLPRRSRRKSARISSAAPSAPIFTVKPEIFISLPTCWDIRTSTRRANITRPSPRIIAVLPHRKPSCAKTLFISNRPNKNRFVFSDKFVTDKTPDGASKTSQNRSGFIFIFDCLAQTEKDRPRRYRRPRRAPRAFLRRTDNRWDPSFHQRCHPL